MSLADQSQQWYPTSVQVTVLQARGLRTKGKNGTNDAYAIMQVAKEKYSTSVAEKSVAPMWKEEATFDLSPSGHGSAERGTLQVHIMHRALVGADKLLGQAVINLLELNEDKSRNKTEWYKLLNKGGKSDKERGEVLLDIQFMRNNMTASMFDLSGMDKPRSRLGKLKDKVRGKKKDHLSETASAIVPSSFTQVLTDSEEEGGRDGEGEDGADNKEKKKKHKLKSLFSPKSNLQRNVSQSMSVLGPLPERSSSLSGSRSSGLNIDASEGKKKFKFMTHKRSGSSDSKTSQSSLSLLGRAKQGSEQQSNLCINGSHVYNEEPQPRRSRGGSNFSLASSGLGSMEDLHRAESSNTSVASADSFRVLKQQSPWAEAEDSSRAVNEEEQIEEEQLANSGTEIEEEKRIRVCNAEERKRIGKIEEKDTIKEQLEEGRLEEEHFEEEKRKIEEEQGRERRRMEEERKVRQEKRVREEEEERERIAEERRIEEEETIRMEKEWKQRDEEKRVREEEEETERIAEERRIEEEETIRKAELERIEEERKRREEEENRVREEREREAEERKRIEEEEAIRKAELERVRMEEERKWREEQERLWKEEEERERLAEERRRQEDQEMRMVEEERRRIEEDTLMKEEEERCRLAEENRRLEEQERRKVEEEEKIRREKEKAMVERKQREEKEESARKEKEEIERILEEKQVVEKENEMRSEEEARFRKQEQDRIRLEEERAEEERKQREEEEEEERFRKEEEELEREAEEERRQEEQERLRKEMRREEEERAERMRMEGEERKNYAEEDGATKKEECTIRMGESEREIIQEANKIKEEEREREEDTIRREMEMKSLDEEACLMQENRLIREEEEGRVVSEKKERLGEISGDILAKDEEWFEGESSGESQMRECQEAKGLREDKERGERDRIRITGTLHLGQNPEVAGESNVYSVDLASTDPFDDISSSNSFEETSSMAAGPHSKTAKVYAVKPSSSSCLNPPQNFVPSNPFLQPFESETEPSQQMATYVLEKKRRAPLPPNKKQFPLEPAVTSTLNPAESKPSGLNPTSRAYSAMPLVRNNMKESISADGKDVVRDKGPAPQPPGKNHVQKPLQREQDVSTVCKMDVQRTDQIKTSNILTQRLVQMIAPVSRPTSTTMDVQKGASQNSIHNFKQPVHIASVTGGSTVVTHNKGPAPCRPQSSSEAFAAPKRAPSSAAANPKASTKSYKHSPETDQVPVVYGSNPFEEDEAEIPLTRPDEITTSWNSENLHSYSHQNSASIDQDIICNTKKKSSKTEHAPLPPAKKTHIFKKQLVMNQGTESASNRHDRVAGVVPDNTVIPPHAALSSSSHPKPVETSDNRGHDLSHKVAMSATSDQITLLSVSLLPSQAQVVVTKGIGEQAGGKWDVPAPASRRPHPVKPMSPQEHQPASVRQGTKDKKSTAISCDVEEKIKMREEPKLTGPYSQLTQDELVSLVMKQQSQLSERDNKISQLEKYIDTLLVRVMEEKPSILMSMSTSSSV